MASHGGAVHTGPAHQSPMWSPSRGAGAPRILVLNQSMLHIIGVPLLILGCLGVGFVLVYLKEVLLPFVVSVFIVYLLRPLVNLLTTPFGRVCWCCATPVLPAAGSLSRGRRGGYTRIPASTSESTIVEPSNSAGGTALATGPLMRRGRAPSPPKYPRTLRGMLSRVASAVVHWIPGSGGSLNGAGGRMVSSAASAGSAAAHSGSLNPSGGTGSARSTPPGTPVSGLLEDECGCCCGCLRITRCPRWFAILVSLSVAAAVLSGLVLLIVDAVQRFQESSLREYLDEAGKVGQALQRWFMVFGIHLEASAIIDAIRKEITLPNIVQVTMTIMVDGVGNALLILLLVLYLLAEQSNHAPNSLRAKVDNQIQRYVVIKTAISVTQGIIVYFILGYMLNVRMAHLFGVLHVLLNYIPTAGPIIATVVPMPIVILDPQLGLTQKIAAFAAPTAVHMVVGNFVEPLVFGTSMELHPVTVLLALAVWYALWGIAGAILAVPITAVMRISLSAVDHPYAIIIIALLEGRLSAATAELDSALDSSSAMDDIELASRTRSAGNASEVGVLPASMQKETLQGLATLAEIRDVSQLPRGNTPPTATFGTHLAHHGSKRGLSNPPHGGRATGDSSDSETIGSGRRPSATGQAPSSPGAHVSFSGLASHNSRDRDRDGMGFASSSMPSANTRRRASPPVPTTVEVSAASAGGSATQTTLAAAAGDQSWRSGSADEWSSVDSSGMSQPADLAPGAFRQAQQQQQPSARPR